MANERKDDHAKPQQIGSSPGIIILQWLTYAFWGWTILSLVWLLYIVVASLMTSADVTSMVPYAIAAALVLLPISVICDLFYGPREPAHKTGAAMVVMVIHAVIFALFGIGMLISGVLTVVQIAIGTSGEHEFQTVWLLTSFISAAIYGLTFLRTLNPAPKLRLGRIFPFVMTAIVGLFIVLGFVGPVTKASLTRDDREIAASMNSIKEAVDRYVETNKSLPVSLGNVKLSTSEKNLVDRGLVTYKSDGEKKLEEGEGTDYRFQLCANYKEEVKDDGYNYRSREEYDDYLSIDDHEAGNVCYKLKTTLFN